MLNRPLARHVLKLLGIPNQHARHLGVLRVLGLGRAEQRLQGDEGRLDREDGRPGGGERVETNSALYYIVVF